MKKLVLFGAFLGFAFLSFAQDKLLTPNQLEVEKWYTSLDEALLNPDKVYKLSLEGKKLDTLPPDIVKLKNLQMLNVNRNKLTTLPSEIGKLTNLQFISAYRNKLNYLPADMANLKNIETLYLGRNRLADMPLWVGGLGKLSRLDLSYNRLTPDALDYIRKNLPKCDVTY